MQKTGFVAAVLLLCVSFNSFGQDREAVLRYISLYRSIAIAEMQRTGVPASIKLAQGIHETGAGQSDLVVRSNNHFGIKCKSNWNGPSVKHDDDARNECFRAYAEAAESYKDHSDFLRGNTRYSSLFKLDPEDYKSWAHGLKKAGYATNPKYPQIIIKLIEEYDLQDFTMIALGKMEDIIIDEELQEQSGIGVGGSPTIIETPIPEEINPAYPSGVFKINETKVVYATKGTVMLNLAQQHDVSLSKLFEFNDMEPIEALEKAQLIFIARKRKKGDEKYHTVAPGETLYSISQSKGIRLGSLLEYNQLNGSLQPAVGEQLYLKEKASSSPKLVDPVRIKETKIEMSSVNMEGEPEEVFYHVVKQKETLYTISKKYEVTVEDIRDWNRLEGSNLRVGQKLKIIK